VPGTRERRFAVYRWTALGFVGLMIVFTGLDLYFEVLHDRAAVVVMALVTAFALLMEYLHGEAEEPGYVNPNEEPLVGEALGADEASDKGERIDGQEGNLIGA